MKRPAVFIDRDGTISEEVGYVNHPSRFRLFPYAASAVKLLNDQGWLAIIITNQAGVARGYFSESMIATVHDNLVRELRDQDATTPAAASEADVAQGDTYGPVNYLAYVPVERLALSTQCGFASGISGNLITEDEQWRKLERVVEVAEEVWR